MGFRLEKKYVNFDINGNVHRVEYTDQFMAKWDSLIKKFGEYNEKIEKRNNDNPRRLMKEYKNNFIKLYNDIFGDDAYAEDFPDSELQVIDIAELIGYLSAEIEKVTTQSAYKYSNRAQRRAKKK